jgi:hypothetical protein
VTPRRKVTPRCGENLFVLPRPLKAISRELGPVHCKLGYFETELEGRLTLAVIEMKSGALTRGRIDLAAVNKDATNRGFMVIARKAASSSG